MPTDELEHELRRAFAKADAGYQHPELARQRLLQHNYRSGSGPRRLAAGLISVAAAGAVVLGLGLLARSAQPQHTGLARMAQRQPVRTARSAPTHSPLRATSTGPPR
jgi:hypothetical protein